MARPDSSKGVVRISPCLDVPQALPKRQLRERQTQKLVATREPPQPTVALVPTHARVEFVPRKELPELRKDHLSRQHPPSPTGPPTSQRVDCDIGS